MGTEEICLKVNFQEEKLGAISVPTEYFPCGDLDPGRNIHETFFFSLIFLLPLDITYIDNNSRGLIRWQHPPSWVQPSWLPISVVHSTTGLIAVRTLPVRNVVTVEKAKTTYYFKGGTLKMD
jgi:hypothetical protein